MRRPSLFAALGALVGALVVPPASATARHRSGAFPRRDRAPRRVPARGHRDRARPRRVLRLVVDGDIYAANLLTGRGRIVSEGPGTPSVGLTTDGRGHLFVAGGPADDARVVDTRTGRILASYRLATSTDTFVNDVVLTRGAAGRGLLRARSVSTPVWRCRF